MALIRQKQTLIKRTTRQNLNLLSLIYNIPSASIVILNIQKITMDALFLNRF